MRRIALLLALALGCGTSASPGIAPFRAVAVGDLVVALPASESASDEALITSAVAFTLGAYEREVGPVRGVLWVEDQVLTSCGSTEAAFVGCNALNGNITAWRGLKLEVPALYHELAHSTYGDPDHLLPVWATINNRMAQLNAQIDSGR